MKVFITGGAGYIGSVLTAHLLRAGMEVTVFDKLLYGGEALVAHFSHPNFRLVRGDVRDRGALRDALCGASALVHLAAVVGEPACSVDDATSWATNLEGTLETLAAARDIGLERFIFISTCSNYGVSPDEVLVDEEAPLKPLSRYAEAKVEAEKLVLTPGIGPHCLVLRFGTICGLSARMRFDLLVNDMARLAALGQPIHVFAPDAWRPFLHVRDAARAIEHCLLAPASLVQGRVFNIVSENSQKRDLVQLVLNHYPNTKIEITDRKPDLRDYRVSADRIRQQVGFIAQNTLEDAFLETAAAVAGGVYRDPLWAGHSAIPLIDRPFTMKDCIRYVSVKEKQVS